LNRKPEVKFMAAGRSSKENQRWNNASGAGFYILEQIGWAFNLNFWMAKQGESID
jgi:hypothetical protein